MWYLSTNLLNNAEKVTSSSSFHCPARFWRVPTARGCHYLHELSWGPQAPCNMKYSSNSSSAPRKDTTAPEQAVATTSATVLWQMKHFWLLNPIWHRGAARSPHPAGAPREAVLGGPDLLWSRKSPYPFSRGEREESEKAVWTLVQFWINSDNSPNVFYFPQGILCWALEQLCRTSMCIQ